MYLEEQPSFWPILVGTVAIVLVLNSLRVVFRKGLRDLPGPILGRFSNFYRLSIVSKGEAPARYRELHKNYGKIVRTGPNHVSVSDVSMIAPIYGIGSSFTKTAFYTTMAPTYGGRTMDSLFTAQDPVYHKTLKSPVAQLFSMTNMRNFEPYADKCTSIFTEAMRDIQGEPIDLAIWLQWYAFDVIASITFQRRFGFLEQRKDIDGMIEGIDKGLKYARAVGQVPQWHPWIVRVAKVLGSIVEIMPRTLDNFMKITEEEIVRYDQQEKTTGRTDFLAQLREKEAKSGKISQRDMINHLSNNLLAGSDTTAISLRACFYYLIKTPRAYRKLVAEIDEADRKGQLSEYITYEECLRLPYLQAVMKEAMRIHPGVGFPLERLVPKEGAMICGVELPAGTNVSMSAPVIHYDREIFGHDADEFRPERWLDASPDRLRLMERNFFAFGYGARTCIGKNISIMEMGKFVPQIFRHFDIEWVSPDTEWKTEASWFWKQWGIIVKFKARDTLVKHN